MHTENASYIDYFPGVCVFGGVEVFTSNYHLGTFCEDGSFTMHINMILTRLTFDMDNIDILQFIQYKMDDSIDVTFKVDFKHVFNNMGSTFFMSNPCSMYKQSLVLQSPIPLGPLHNNELGIHKVLVDIDTIEMSFFYTFYDTDNCNITVYTGYVLIAELVPLNGICNTKLATNKNSRIGLYRGGKNVCTQMCSSSSQCLNAQPGNGKIALFKNRDMIEVYAYISANRILLCSLLWRKHIFNPHSLKTVKSSDYTIENESFHELIGMCNNYSISTKYNHNITLSWKRHLQQIETHCNMEGKAVITYIVNALQGIHMSIVLIYDDNTKQYKDVYGTYLNMYFEICITSEVYVTVKADYSTIINLKLIYTFHPVQRIPFKFIHDVYFLTGSTVPYIYSLNCTDLDVDDMGIIAKCNTEVIDALMRPNHMIWYYNETVLFYKSNPNIFIFQPNMFVTKHQTLHHRYAIVLKQNMSGEHARIVCASLGPEWKLLPVIEFDMFDHNLYYKLYMLLVQHESTTYIKLHQVDGILVDLFHFDYDQWPGVYCHKTFDPSM